MRDIVKNIFMEYDDGYTANYGWQKNFDEDMYSFGYINSYKCAADLLVEQQTPDLNIFPIMFNYRQYLELLLKNICYKSMKKKEYKKLINSVSHDLGGVWMQAKVILAQYKPEEQLEFVENIVKIFNVLDPYSFNFRYEFDKKLNRSIKPKEFHINTFQLKQYIDIVDSYLRDTYDSV